MEESLSINSNIKIYILKVNTNNLNSTKNKSSTFWKMSTIIKNEFLSIKKGNDIDFH